jgi:hypothetical protein
MKNDSRRRRVVAAVSIDAQALMYKLNAPPASLLRRVAAWACVSEHRQEIIFFKH